MKKAFGIDKIPSKPTLSRILNMIDGGKVATVIIEIMRENIGNVGDIVAVDGKAIRSTAKKGETTLSITDLTAYFTESGVILGQESIHEKTNEIPVFQSMLDYLDIKGKTITADAMHCQKTTSKKIVEKGGDYGFGLKENQKCLYEDAEVFINDEKSVDEEWAGLSSVFATVNNLILSLLIKGIIANIFL